MAHIDGRATRSHARNVACRDVNHVIALGDTRGMIVIPRSHPGIVSLTLAVRQDDVEMVSVRLQRDRVRMVARVDPERERARDQGRPESGLSAHAGEHQENDQDSHQGRLHGARISAALVTELGAPNEFGRAAARP